MKNKILFLILSAIFAIAGLSGCEDVTTAGYTSISNYPSIEILGGNPLAVAIGSDYKDAGVYSELFGKDVSDKVEIESNVNTTGGGVYIVSYTVTSTDGFKRTATRTVVVCDTHYNTDDLSGTYKAHVIRDNNPAREYSGNPVTLKKSSLGFGIYEISDWIGGFYAVGFDYGSSYAFSGLMQINGDNEVIEISMSNPWGDSFNSVIGTYDPTTKVISYNASWRTYVFVVDMTK